MSKSFQHLAMNCSNRQRKEKKNNHYVRIKTLGLIWTKSHRVDDVGNKKKKNQPSGGGQGGEEGEMEVRTAWQGGSWVYYQGQSGRERERKSESIARSSWDGWSMKTQKTRRPGRFEWEAARRKAARGGKEGRRRSGVVGGGGGGLLLLLLLQGTAKRSQSHDLAGESPFHCETQPNVHLTGILVFFKKGIQDFFFFFLYLGCLGDVSEMRQVTG